MLDKGKSYISEFDLRRLKELIKVAEEFGDKRVVRYLEELDEEQDRAESMKPQQSRMTSLAFRSAVFCSLLL
jgi:hypothetical protein